MARERSFAQGHTGRGGSCYFHAVYLITKLSRHRTGVLLKESDLSEQRRCAALLSFGEKGAMSASRFLLWEIVGLLGLPTVMQTH